MNRKYLVLIVLIFSFYLFVNNVYAWTNDTWEKRYNITINNTLNSNALYNYQVLVNFTHPAGVTSNLEEIRVSWFNKTLGNDTFIDFAVESSSGGWSWIWAEVPYIENSSTETIYIYYNNTSAVSNVESFNNTFIYGDEFEDSSVDDAIWDWVDDTANHGYIETGGHFRLDINASADWWSGATENELGLRTAGKYGNDAVNYSFEVNITNATNTQNIHFGLATYYDGDNVFLCGYGCEGAGCLAWRNISSAYVDTNVASWIAQDNSADANKNSQYLRIVKIGKQYLCEYSRNRTTWIQVGNRTFTNVNMNQSWGMLWAKNYGTNKAYPNYEFAIMRNYSNPEPTYEVNSEEVLSSGSDTTMPEWENLAESSSDPSVYSVSPNYGFQVNCTDETGMQSAIFEHNLTGSWANVTCSNTSAIYYTNITSMKASVLNYSFICNDTSGNQNRSDYATFTVSQMPAALTLSPSNGTVTYENTTTQYCTDNVTADCSIYRNNTLVTNNTAVIFGVGYYEYITNISDNVNYSYTTLRQNQTISQRNAAVTVKPDASTATYSGSTYTPYCYDSASFMNCTVYQNNSAISNNTAIYLAAGIYAFNANITDTANYSSTTDSETYTLNKAVPVLTMSNGSSTLNTSGLVGYWRLESFNATNYTSDYSGYSRDVFGANFSSNPASTTTGVLGQGVQFDGVNDAICSQTNAVSSDYPNGVTFTAWVYRLDNDGRKDVLVHDFWLTLQGTSGAYVNVYNGTAYKQGSTFVPLNAWTQIGGILNTTHTMIITNGVITDTYAGAGNLSGGSNTIQIGGRTCTGDNNFPFNGSIDEVMIWNRSLSAAEIQLLYQTTNTYETQTTFSGTESNSNDGSYILYRNDTNVQETENGTAITMPAGYHYYIFNTSGNANYTMVSLLLPLNTAQKNANVQVYPVTQTLTYNASTTTQYCTDDSALLDCSVYRNNSAVTNNTAIYLAAGIYAFIGNITDSTNYTSSSDTETLTISKGNISVYSFAINDTYMSFNGTMLLSVNASVYDNITATLQKPSGIVNITDFTTSGGNYTKIINKTDLGSTQSDAGIVNITHIYSGDTNYTQLSNSTTMQVEYAKTYYDSSLVPVSTYASSNDFVNIIAYYNETTLDNIINNCSTTISGTIYYLNYLGSGKYERKINVSGWSEGPRTAIINCTNSSYQSQSSVKSFTILPNASVGFSASGQSQSASFTNQTIKFSVEPPIIDIYLAKNIEGFANIEIQNNENYTIHINVVVNETLLKCENYSNTTLHPGNISIIPIIINKHQSDIDITTFVVLNAYYNNINITRNVALIIHPIDLNSKNDTDVCYDDEECQSNLCEKWRCSTQTSAVLKIKNIYSSAIKWIDKYDIQLNKSIGKITSINPIYLFLYANISIICFGAIYKVGSLIVKKRKKYDEEYVRE